jgi:hypothetical protein
MASNYNKAYEALVELVEYMVGDSAYYRVVRYDASALKDKLSALKTGKILFNNRNPFLNKIEKKSRVDPKVIMDQINIIYETAVKCDIGSAPKSTIFEVKLNTSIFFL